MALVDDPSHVDAYTAPGPGTLSRVFGWGTLAVMTVFLLNNILTFWYEWPGIAPFFGWQSSGEVGLQAGIQLALYVVAIALTIFYVQRTRGRMLRTDGEKISNFNRFLVRAAFWVVLLVGSVDAAISFIRVEGMLEDVFSPDVASGMNKSSWRGFYVHVPLVILGIFIGAITRSLGFIWLALLVVIAELLIVFSRFIFSYEQAFMGDLVRFWYAALFLFASAYTLLEEGHVRVDVVYASLGRKKRAVVNSVGAILLGMTLCWTILILGMWSKAAIINSPILVYETTQTGFGMYVKYFMAGFLAVFAVTMMLQFVAAFFDARADRRGEPGGREISSEIIH
jgi:TRAP-type mannitol/chloroaromatic compound transport system permease small subunit